MDQLYFFLILSEVCQTFSINKYFLYKSLYFFLNKGDKILKRCFVCASIFNLFKNNSIFLLKWDCVNIRVVVNDVYLTQLCLYLCDNNVDCKDHLCLEAYGSKALS